jgi:integrase
MASFEKRINSKKEVSYRVKIRIKGYPVLTATFDRKDKAKDWVRITEQKIKDGKYGITDNSNKYTVNDIIDRYIKTVLIHKGNIKQDWESQLKWWASKIGYYTLSSVSPSLISETRDILLSEKNNRGEVRKNSTINRYTTTLQCVFAIAINEWDLLDTNPFTKIKKLPEPKGRIRYLNENERITLLNECKKATNPYLYPAVITALSTGARKMEILSLKWENVDLEEGIAIVPHTKNGTPRTLNLLGPIQDEFQKLKSIKRDNDIYVFPSIDGKKPFDITRSWKKAISNAEIKDFRFHDLRHTTASYLAMEGKSLIEIKEMLNHKDLQSVNRYSHIAENHKRTVTAEMNNLIFGGNENE